LLLRDTERAPAPSRPKTGGRATPASTLAPGETEAEVHVSSSAAVSSSSGSAAALAQKLSVLGAGARDRAELEAELLAAPSAELVAKRPELEELLRRSPRLAPGAARAFRKLDDRESLFVVSRALVVCPEDSSVREALREGAECGHAARREVSLLALASLHDERAIDLARSALDDASAPPRVRAAGAWALAQDADHAPSTALATARTLAQTPAEDGHLRAEALHLLAASPPAPQDRALALAALAEPSVSPEVALAAARLALVAGEDRAAVARALAAHPNPRCGQAARVLQEAP
jgi:hypothetical protein